VFSVRTIDTAALKVCPDKKHVVSDEKVFLILSAI
jgi:hypothetical protein